MSQYDIREWREARSLSREELVALVERARTSGADPARSPSTLKKIELGQTRNPRRETLDAIAGALQVTRHDC